VSASWSVAVSALANNPRGIDACVWRVRAHTTTKPDCAGAAETVVAMAAVFQRFLVAITLRAVVEGAPWGQMFVLWVLEKW
jgi:hypothetical protein